MTTSPTAVLDPFRDPRQPELQAIPAPALMTVTPDMAGEWLARNDGNRPLRHSLVAQLARDMKAGNWAVNGESVKIASDGTLIDGQHRLYACAQAKVPFVTLVVTGLPREAQRTIDTGAKRRVSDQLSLSGEKNAVILAALARWHLAWERGWRGKLRSDLEPTHQEMLQHVEDEPRLRDAADFASKARQEFRSVAPSVFGMAWLLFTAIDEGGALEFLGRVRDGADINVGHPAHTLRARLWRAREMDERLSEQEKLALFCIAWNHFHAGTSIGRMQLPKGGLTAKNFPDPK